MGPLEGKTLAIDTIFQTRINTIENHEILRKLFLISSRVLGVSPKSYSVTRYYILMNPIQ